MIRIKNADSLHDRIDLIYNPLTELSLGLDILRHPEHNRLHSSWARGILARLSMKEKQQLEYFESLLNGYLNIDLHYDYLSFDYRSENNFSACSAYLRDKSRCISRLKEPDFEQLTSFLAFMWDNYLLPVVAEHHSAVEYQMAQGKSILQRFGLRGLFGEITERISFNSDGLLKIEKYIESDFDAGQLKHFYVELSIFAFPYLVISDRHEEGYFYLSWDVPFREDSTIVPGIEAISASAFALSDKSRLRILLLLYESPMTQKELTRLMGFAKSTISRHINILHAAGFIEQSGPGRNVVLRLNRNALNGFSDRLFSWLD